MQTFQSHLLYDPDDIKKNNKGKAPETYKSFQAAASRLPAPASPVNDSPEKLPPVDAKAKGTDEKSTSVPTLEEAGYNDKPTTPFHVRTNNLPHIMMSYFRTCHQLGMLNCCPTLQLRAWPDRVHQCCRLYRHIQLQVGPHATARCSASADHPNDYLRVATVNEDMTAIS